MIDTTPNAVPGSNPILGVIFFLSFWAFLGLIWLIFSSILSCKCKKCHSGQKSCMIVNSIEFLIFTLKICNLLVFQCMFAQLWHGNLFFALCIPIWLTLESNPNFFLPSLLSMTIVQGVCYCSKTATGATGATVNKPTFSTLFHTQLCAILNNNLRSIRCI